jgi:hypothetical protein
VANNTALTDETVARYGLRANNNADNSTNLVNSTLSGIGTAANIAYHIQQGLITGPGNAPNLSPAPNQYIFQQMTNFAAMSRGEACAPSWKDPRDGVMADLNALLFRIGLFTAQNYDRQYLEPLLDEGVRINRTVQGSIISPVEVFDSNMSFFAGAACVQLGTIVLILFTFYGWWDIGRSVSLSPLEVWISSRRCWRI